MIDHPDLDRLKRDVHALRVRTAWGALSGNNALPPGMQMHLDIQAQTLAPPKNVVKRRVKPSITKHSGGSKISKISGKKRAHKPPTLVPNLTPQEVDFFGCKNTVDGFKTTSFGNPLSFATGTTRVMCSPLADRRFSYKATFSFTHGLNGKLMKNPITVSSPTLRTSRDKLDVMELVKFSLLNMTFSLYVRIVSRMRKLMFLPNVAVDDELAFDPGYVVVDPKLPEKVSETFFPLEKNVDDIVKQLCRANNIEYIDPNLFPNDSTSSSCSDE
jgi:hypothetical protein